MANGLLQPKVSSFLVLEGSCCGLLQTEHNLIAAEFEEDRRELMEEPDVEDSVNSEEVSRGRRVLPCSSSSHSASAYKTPGQQCALALAGTRCNQSSGI